MRLCECVSVQEAMAGNPQLYSRGSQGHGWGLRHPSHLWVRHGTVGTEQTAWTERGGVCLLGVLDPPTALLSEVLGS